MGTTGVFVLSFDCEMLWGCHHIGGLAAFPYLRDCRATYRRLLDVLRRYEIPATFAFVGGIALSPEEFDRRVAEFSPAYRAWTSRARDAAGSLSSVLFDPSLIEAVARDPLQHEIGAHGFTHRCFTDMRASDAERDFAAAAAALRPYSARITSFVFPENRCAHIDVLAKSPFTLYRSSERRWYSGYAGPYARLGHYVDQALAVTPPLATIDRHQRPAVISDSLMLFTHRGVRKFIPGAVRRKKAQRGLDDAIRRGGVFHLWMHPWELGHTPKSFDVLDSILATVAIARAAGQIDVRTMAQAAFG